MFCCLDFDCLRSFEFKADISEANTFARRLSVLFFGRDEAEEDEEEEEGEDDEENGKSEKMRNNDSNSNIFII